MREPAFKRVLCLEWELKPFLPQNEAAYPLKLQEVAKKLLEILKQDGIVAIATVGQDGPHMVNTWNSYVRIAADGRLLIPAGYMHRTEANIAFNPDVLITLGSSKVQGLHGPGAGFLIKGKGAFITSGPDFDLLKSKLDWLRATLAVTPDSVTQTW
jgi:Pyridoxamine 5'-phosphate oxidase